MPEMRAKAETAITRRDIECALRDGAPSFVRRRLQAGCFVSERFPYLYFSTPKCACSTTKTLLWRLERLGRLPANVHARPPGDPRLSPLGVSPERALDLLFGEQTVRFRVFRDPVDRLVSGYCNKIRDLPPQYASHRQAIVARFGLADEKEIAFDHFAQFVCAQPDGERNPHWMTQRRLALADAVPYSVVVRQTHYAEDMAAVFDAVGIPRRRRPSFRAAVNATEDEKPYVSPSTARMIMRAYQCDYDLGLAAASLGGEDRDEQKPGVAPGARHGSVEATAERAAKPAVAAVRAPRQAVIFLTHRNAPRIHRHFARLRHDLRDTMPAFLCQHRPRADMPEPPFRPDFTISVKDGADTLPHRDRLRRASGLPDVQFVDLAMVPAMLRPELSDFEHLWLVEEDLDYSGDWSVFFQWAGASAADLIGFNFLSREQSPDWMHWRMFRCPNSVADSSQAHGMLMLSRFSRRFLRTYQKEIGNPEWAGHTEALYATVALHHGLRVAAFGATERHPRVSLVADEAGPADFADKSTFSARPVQGNSYFHEKPEAFPRRDRLVHPIKIADPQPQAARPAAPTASSSAGAEQAGASRSQENRAQTGFGNLALLPLWRFVAEERADDGLLVFLHIPKTAGSSFTAELAETRQPFRNVDVDYADLTLPYWEKLNRAVLGFAAEMRHQRFRACSGHFKLPHAKIILEARPDGRLITFLRDPVERLLSDYRYMRSPAHPYSRQVLTKYPDIESFIEDKDYQNPMLKRFAGTGDIEVEEALRLLDEQYAFVGVFELYPMCFNIVFRLFGQNRMPTLHHRRTADTPENQVEMTPELRRRILRLNEKDAAIYDHVRARLEAKRREWTLLDES